jgi:hypothetical protein
MSAAALLTTTETWWINLSEAERLECVDQRESWTFKSRRPWGQKTAWKPAGRVLELWQNSVCKEVIVIMNARGNHYKIYGNESHPPGLAQHLWMVADRAICKEARPTIVIACKEKRFAKNAIQLLREMESFKGVVLGFAFLALNSKVQYKAGSGGSHPQPEFLKSLCGAEVLLPSIQTSLEMPSSEWPRATIGGLLKLDWSYYALTVAHILYPSDPETDDESSIWSDSESECGIEVHIPSDQNSESSKSGAPQRDDESGKSLIARQQSPTPCSAG